MNICPTCKRKKTTETAEETEYNDKMLWKIDGQRVKIEEE